MLDDADFRAAARESRYLRDFADRTASRAALYLGDLERCIEITRRLCASPSLLMAESAVLLLGAAALLAGDESAADAGAVGRGGAPLEGSWHPDVSRIRDPSTLTARWRTGPSRRRDPSREHRPPRSACGVHRDAPVSRSGRGRRGGVWPSRRCDRWHARDAPRTGGARPRSRPRPRRTRTDGMRHSASPSSTSFAWSASTRSKGSPVSRPTAESWAECLRLAAAASRLREETGYRWRFALRAGPPRRRGRRRDRGARIRGGRARRVPRARRWTWREAAALRESRSRRASATEPRVGGADTNRAPGRHARRRRPHEPADRRATSHGSCHGEDPPRPRLHQDRSPLTDRARH